LLAVKIIKIIKKIKTLFYTLNLIKNAEALFLCCHFFSIKSHVRKFLYIAKSTGSHLLAHDESSAVSGLNLA
jgi:hypothetical protein